MRTITAKLFGDLSSELFLKKNVGYSELTILNWPFQKFCKWSVVTRTSFDQTYINLSFNAKLNSKIRSFRPTFQALVSGTYDLCLNCFVGEKLWHGRLFDDLQGPVFTVLCLKTHVLTGGRDGFIYSWHFNKNMDMDGELQVKKETEFRKTII